MNCPHCLKSIRPVMRQLEKYNLPNKIVACPHCKRGIVVSMQTTFALVPYRGAKTQDDYGVTLCNS